MMKCLIIFSDIDGGLYLCGVCSQPMLSQLTPESEYPTFSGISLSPIGHKNLSTVQLGRHWEHQLCIKIHLLQTIHNLQGRWEQGGWTDCNGCVENLCKGGGMRFSAKGVVRRISAREVLS